MEKKVFDIKGRQIIENSGKKYSELLEAFLEPFAKELDHLEYSEDIIQFGVVSWNIGNNEIIEPNPNIENVLKDINDTPKEAKLMGKMIAYKKEHFSAYSHYIEHFELLQDSPHKAPVLRVLTQDKETHLKKLENLHEEFLNEYQLTQESDGIIDRKAVIIKARKPFFDWYNALYPEDDFYDKDKETTTVYLIDIVVEDEEKWLKKKYDTLFKLQLEDWHLNKKEWPQKRNYKLFKEWFQVSVCDMIYDLEKTPIFKE